MSSKIIIGIIFAILVMGIVGAGSLITKVVTIDKSVLSSANTNNIDYSKYTYKETIDGNYKLICIYNAGKIAYPCTKILSSEADEWRAVRIEALIKGQIQDKTKSTDEGIIDVRSSK